MKRIPSHHVGVNQLYSTKYIKSAEYISQDIFCAFFILFAWLWQLLSLSLLILISMMLTISKLSYIIPDWLQLTQIDTVLLIPANVKGLTSVKNCDHYVYCKRLWEASAYQATAASWLLLQPEYRTEITAGYRARRIWMFYPFLSSRNDSTNYSAKQDEGNITDDLQARSVLFSSQPFWRNRHRTSRLTSSIHKITVTLFFSHIR